MEVSGKSSVVWRTQSLGRLAQSLPHTLLSGRVDSTTKKYLYAFGKWKQWAESKEEVDVFPVQDVQFTLYLQHLAETTESKAVVEGAVNAVSWAHQKAGLQPVLLTQSYARFYLDCRDCLPDPNFKKEPISVEMLTTMV